MAAKSTLTVVIDSDASAAVAGLDKAGAGLDGLGRSADRTADKLQASTRGMTAVADSADDMEGKAAKATGALGALSSGFELAGLPAFADGLNSAAMATDFVSGAMDSFTLLTELNSVALVKNKIASVAQTAATRAQALATKAAAIAQRAFNLAMSLNPIGLIVAAVALLVGGFILLYKKSATFRDIVQTAGEIGKRALTGIRDAAGWVVEKVSKIVGWLGKFVIPLPFLAAIELLKIVLPKVSGWISDAVGWLGKLKFPSPPKWITKLVPGGNSAAAMVAPGVNTRGATTTAAAPAIVINVTGALDPEKVARQIRRILDGHSTRVGLAS